MQNNRINPNKASRIYFILIISFCLGILQIELLAETRTNQTSTDANTTKLTREESTGANTVVFKTTVDKAAGSCSQAFITERHGWLRFLSE